MGIPGMPDISTNFFFPPVIFLRRLFFVFGEQLRPALDIALAIEVWR